MKKLSQYLIAFAVIASLSMSGCATVGGWFNDSNVNARILTKGIVAEYLSHNKGSIPVVLQVSTDALTYVKSGPVTVDMLQTYVMKEIAPSLSKLTPDGQAAVIALISELKDQLKKQLPANGIDPAKTPLEIVTFLTWINDVAKASQGIL